MGDSINKPARLDERVRENVRRGVEGKRQNLVERASRGDVLDPKEIDEVLRLMDKEGIPRFGDEGSR